MLYTVKNSVEDFPHLVYNDGVKKLFLYTDLGHLHSIVEKDGVALGRNEARREGILTLISSLKDLNISTEQIMEQLMQKFSLSAEEANAYLNQNN